MKGLTGTIKFDQHGLRTDFTLEIVELKKDGLNKVCIIYQQSECSSLYIYNIHRWALGTKRQASISHGISPRAIVKLSRAYRIRHLLLLQFM